MCCYKLAPTPPLPCAALGQAVKHPRRLSVLCFYFHFCCMIARHVSCQIYTDVIKCNNIPQNIDAAQLAKIVKISDSFDTSGTDEMRRFVEFKAKEVRWT